MYLPSLIPVRPFSAALGAAALGELELKRETAQHYCGLAGSHGAVRIRIIAEIVQGAVGTRKMHLKILICRLHAVQQVVQIHILFNNLFNSAVNHLQCTETRQHGAALFLIAVRIEAVVLAFDFLDLAFVQLTVLIA